MYGKSNHSTDLVFEHMAKTNRLGVPEELITALHPNQAGKMGLIFLQIGMAMMSHATDDAEYEESSQRVHMLYGARTLLEKIDRGIKQIEIQVGRGDTLKQAVKCAATEYGVAEGTLHQAVHMRADKSARLKNVEIDRLIEQGWPDRMIALHLKCTRTTVWRHHKLLAATS